MNTTIKIYTDDHDQYYDIPLKQGENIDSVIEYVISELSYAKQAGLPKIDACYFAYGKDVIALYYKPEGISWKII